MTPLRLQRGEHVVEVGPRLVVLVDEDEPRDLGGNAPLPRQLGADLDAVDRADHEDGEVGDAERRHLLADEVGVAGRVEQVDLVRLAVGGLPFERGDAERQRHAPFDLLGIRAGHRGAVFDPADRGS